MTTDTTPGTTQPLVITGLEELREREGTELGVSGWVTVDQENITTFAKLTGDQQWIHVDPERAKAGPFGTTIQHGFLTLGLATGLLWSVCVVEGFAHILNYGLNRVRFEGRITRRRRLRPGRHRVTVQATDAAGNVSQERHASFRIVRR